MIKCSVYRLLERHKGEKTPAERKNSASRSGDNMTGAARQEIMSSFFYNHERKKNEIKRGKR